MLYGDPYLERDRYWESPPPLAVCSLCGEELYDEGDIAEHAGVYTGAVCVKCAEHEEDE